MSVVVSPSSPSPLANRPHPPNRANTRSHAASPLVAAVTLSPHVATGAEPISSLIIRMDGLMGGLREGTEDELRRASREALEKALKEQWDVRDRLMTQLGEGEDRQKRMEEKTQGLERDLRSMHERERSAYLELSRLEADLEEREGLLERLGAQVMEAEKQAREAQHRVSEQDKGFDVERQALQAHERHLRSRLQSLAIAQPAQNARLSGTHHYEEELANLTISQSTLLAQLDTLTKEVRKLSCENLRLQEENEGWEFLVRERTFSAKGREGGLLSRTLSQDDLIEPSRSQERQGSSQLEALDEELEMDELHSDLEAQSPIFEEDHGFVRDLDGRVRSESPKDVMLAPPRRRLRPRRQPSGEVPGMAGGVNLAAELGRAEVDSNIEGTGAPEEKESGDTLRTEIKALREANKALTLYCSKIIDRIIAQEGFEHILSVDYKTRRMGSRSASGSSGTRGTQSLREISASMQAKANREQPAGSDPPATESEAKKTRPLSMMVRAMSGTVEKVDTAKQETRTVSVKPDIKAEKRAKRGFSLDFRSLGFGFSSLPESPKLALKPLTLSTQSSPTIPPPASSVQARKLEPQDEDEEDQRERHRMETTLKLMGIERPSPSTEDSPIAFAPSAACRTGKGGSESPPASVSSVYSRTSRASTLAAETRKTSTPLSRLSSALGTNDPPPAHQEGIPTPESAAAALRAFDAQEAEQTKALSLGRARAGYTSPSPESIRRANSRRRPSSGQGGQGGKVEQGDAEKQKMMGKSESASTLWSMGSSRPASREVDAGLLSDLAKEG